MVLKMSEGFYSSSPFHWRNTVRFTEERRVLTFASFINRNRSFRLLFTLCKLSFPRYEDDDWRNIFSFFNFKKGWPHHQIITRKCRLKSVLVHVDLIIRQTDSGSTNGDDLLFSWFDHKVLIQVSNDSPVGSTDVRLLCYPESVSRTNQNRIEGTSDDKILADFN